MWPPATPEPYNSNQLPFASKGSSPPPREKAVASRKYPFPQLPDPAQYPDARFLYNQYPNFGHHRLAFVNAPAYEHQYNSFDQHAGQYYTRVQRYGLGYAGALDISQGPRPGQPYLAPQHYQGSLPNFPNGHLAELKHPSSYALKQQASSDQEATQQNSRFSQQNYSASLSGSGAEENRAGLEYNGQSRSEWYSDPVREQWLNITANRIKCMLRTPLLLLGLSPENLLKPKYRSRATREMLGSSFSPQQVLHIRINYTVA